MKNFYLYTLLFLLFISCNKTEDNKESISLKDTVHSKNETQIDTTVVQDLSPIDSSLKLNNKPVKDSIQTKKDKKRIADSVKFAKESEVKLQAYYFHPTARCSTCLNIEAYSIEAIKEWEKNSNKKVSWSDLNIEDSTNEHYIDEYELKFSSLIIVKYKGGKKDSWKNLEETWQLVNDKSSFTKYVKTELDKFIK